MVKPVGGCFHTTLYRNIFRDKVLRDFARRSMRLVFHWCSTLFCFWVYFHICLFYFHGSFPLLPCKVPPTSTEVINTSIEAFHQLPRWSDFILSMEVNLPPRKFPRKLIPPTHGGKSTSMEASTNFHRIWCRCSVFYTFHGSQLTSKEISTEFNCAYPRK